jgi:hypothetical protein
MLVICVLVLVLVWLYQARRKRMRYYCVLTHQNSTPIGGRISPLIQETSGLLRRPPCRLELPPEVAEIDIANDGGDLSKSFSTTSPDACHLPSSRMRGWWRSALVGYPSPNFVLPYSLALLCGCPNELAKTYRFEMT